MSLTLGAWERSGSYLTAQVEPQIRQVAGSKAWTVRRGETIVTDLPTLDPALLDRVDKSGRRDAEQERLDHFGFIMDSPESVDRMFEQVERSGARIVHPPKGHRDSSYSFYLADPDGNTIQVLYEPTISRKA